MNAVNNAIKKINCSTAVEYADEWLIAPWYLMRISVHLRVAFSFLAEKMAVTCHHTLDASDTDWQL